MVQGYDYRVGAPERTVPTAIWMIRVRRRATTITKALIGRQPNVGMIFLNFFLYFFYYFRIYCSKKKNVFVFSDFRFLCFVSFLFLFLLFSVFLVGY